MSRANPIRNWRNFQLRYWLAAAGFLSVVLLLALYYSAPAGERGLVLSQIQAAGGGVGYFCERGSDRPKDGPWLLRMLFGDAWADRHFSDVSNVSLTCASNQHLADRVLPRLRVFPHLVGLSVSACTLSDADLAQLRGLRLQSLSLAGVDLRHRRLECLSGFSSLRDLDLSGTGIGDGAAGSIGKLPQLQSLNLERTRITDRGLAEICSGTCGPFVELDLALTNVSDKGVMAAAGRLGPHGILNVAGTKVTTVAAQAVRQMPNAVDVLGP